MSNTVQISGVWIHRFGDNLEVRVTFPDGTERIILSESLADGDTISHHVGASGIMSRPVATDL